MHLAIFLGLTLAVQPLLSREPDHNQNIESILHFWFSNNVEKGLYNRALWWQKNTATDSEIQKRFGEIRLQAINGKLDHWLDSPKGTLAYILLIDQFSRNMFRGTPEMYRYDFLALNAAKNCLARGDDQKLSMTERVFIYMPFEHSESLSDQKRSVKLFKKLQKEAADKDKKSAASYAHYAEDHCAIIEKFGRFPHRNAILSRKNTLEETDFLKKHSGY